MHALRAHVSYKTAADWLDWPYIRIPDWLFLNANEGSNRRTVEPKFLDGFKNMKAAFRQQLVAIFVSHRLSVTSSAGLHKSSYADVLWDCHAIFFFHD